MQINTVRVRPDWVAKAVEEAGGVAAFAADIGVDKSTVSRQVNRKSEASPRFIGAVLARYPVQFYDAFDVTTEEVTMRLARPVKTPAA